MLSEQLLSENRSPVPVAEYVCSFKERLHHAWHIAKIHLSATQVKMKSRFDKKSVNRKFNPADLVLVLLSSGFCVAAKFSGLYTVARKLSDTEN